MAWRRGVRTQDATCDPLAHRVGNQNLGLLDALGLSDANALLQQEARVQVRLAQRSARPLDDGNARQIRRAAQPHHRVNWDRRDEAKKDTIIANTTGEMGKVVLVLPKDLGGQSGAGNVEQVLAQQRRVGAVVLGAGLQSRQGRGGGRPQPRNDQLRVQVVLNQPLRLADQLSRQHADARRAVPHCAVLQEKLVSHGGSKWTRKTSLTCVLLMLTSTLAAGLSR
jgi:hypothetical protein